MGKWQDGFLKDAYWDQLTLVLKKHGCYQTKNSRDVMEAILWKLRTGGPWRDIPEEFCSWQTAYDKFNRWAQKGLWDDFFLLYEAKLIGSGLSQTEATYELISMQVELGVVKKEQFELLEEELQLKYTCFPMRMEIQSILKSLGVRSTIARSRKI